MSSSLAARVVLGVLFVGVLVVEVLFVGDGGADRRDLWFGAAHPLGKHGERVVLGLVEGELLALGLGVGGVDVGVLAGAGERDVSAFLGGVFGDDQVGGVGRVALGGERVLNVREPDARFVGLGAGEPGGAAVCELEGGVLVVGVDVAARWRWCRWGGAEVGVGELVADLDLVAGVQPVGAAGRREGLGPSWPSWWRIAWARALSSSRCSLEVWATIRVRLPARRSPCAASRAASSASRWSVGEVDAAAGRVSAQGAFVVVRRGRVLGRGGRRGRGRGRFRVSWTCAAFDLAACSRSCQSPPAPTACGLAGVADQDQPAPDASTAERSWWCSRVDASAASSWITVVARRAGAGQRPAGRASAAVEYAVASTPAVFSSVARRCAASAAVLVTITSPPRGLVGARDRGQGGALAGPGLPLDDDQRPVRAADL